MSWASLIVEAGDTGSSWECRLDDSRWTESRTGGRWVALMRGIMVMSHFRGRAVNLDIGELVDAFYNVF